MKVHMAPSLNFNAYRWRFLQPPNKMPQSPLCCGSKKYFKHIIGRVFSESIVYFLSSNGMKVEADFSQNFS